MRRDELEAAVAKARTVTCSVPGCGRPLYHIGRRLCHPHYRRVMTTGDLRPEQPLRIASWAGIPCAAGDCAAPVVARGLCATHYRRARHAAD